jgi:hypothetical protein
MSDAPAKPISDTKGKDKETLDSIVKELTESMTGDQSTRHWAEDALWFDIPPFASRGIQPALKFFDRVLGSCRKKSTHGWAQDFPLAISARRGLIRGGIGCYF